MKALSRRFMKKNIVITWLICVLGLVLLFAWMGNNVLPKVNHADSGEALINSDFTLQSGTGKIVKDEDFRGKYMLVYFGYTHCPDVCPTTLLLISSALSDIGATAKNIQPIFITLDPERDTPKATATYAGHFSKDLLGLSGTPEQIKHVADGFKVYYSKVEQKDSAIDYVVDHSGFIYLIGPDGKYIDHYAANVSEQELARGLSNEVH
jgi:cytochrome oxidase Cu insertion factor (SCO1/SenC/PrrC family)